MVTIVALVRHYRIRLGRPLDRLGVYEGVAFRPERRRAPDRRRPLAKV